MGITVQKLIDKNEIPIIVNAFAKSNWTFKPAFIFLNYLEEQEKLERNIWVSFYDNLFAGYITLKRKSDYEPFLVDNIPEIKDLNVLPKFRSKGIGSALMDFAEKEGRKQNNLVGIGVGLYGGLDGGYGAAQRLYIKRGYIPDGRGVTYNSSEPAEPGKDYPLDDNLILWLTKKLTK